MSKLSRFAHSLPLSGRLPSRRALAAIAKLQGYRVERRWPYIHHAEVSSLNLGFQDILEFQYARARRFFVVSVGAYDGLENDPIGKFIRDNDCSGILVEPQPNAFARLSNNYADYPKVHLLNVAIDQQTGFRDMFYIPPGIANLPRWTEQLASFDRDHLVRHADRAPALLEHIRNQQVQTLSFDDLLTQHVPGNRIDVLQIDAEGIDADLISWFPFERIKPGVLHYEVAHMSASQLSKTRELLASLGYVIFPADGPLDDMAIAL